MNDKIIENELGKVSGGALKKPKAKNAFCPKCGKQISICTYKEIEGHPDTLGTYWCLDCDISWIRDENDCSYMMVSLMPNADGKLEELGPFENMKLKKADW